MKIIIFFFIILPITLSVNSAIASEDCSFNFKDFHSIIDNKSKKFKSIKPETKDEISKTVTQKAKLKSGEDVLFIGGGCAHFSYSFNYSNLRIKSKKIQDLFKKAYDLLVSTEVVKNYTNPLISSLDKALKAPIKKSKTEVYDLPCGDAMCSLDLSSKTSIKINYSFIL